MKDLVMDARLTCEARIMGLYIAGLGEGEHEISTEEWQRVLGRSKQGGAPTRRTIANYASELVTWGWIEKKPGGSGSPRYKILRTSERHVEPLPGSLRHVEQKSYVPQRDTQSDSTGLSETRREPPLPTLKKQLITTTASTSASEARASREITDRANRAIEESEVLAGCRGALGDYVALRVAREHQYGYVQSVAGLIQGTDEWAWTGPTGAKVHEGRQQMVAGALNELSQSTETGKHFSARPGSVKNLRSTIRYKVSATMGVQRDAKKAEEKADRKAKEIDEATKRRHARGQIWPGEEVANAG